MKSPYDNSSLTHKRKPSQMRGFSLGVLKAISWMRKGAKGDYFEFMSESAALARRRFLDGRLPMFSYRNCSGCRSSELTTSCESAPHFLTLHDNWVFLSKTRRDSVSTMALLIQTLSHDSEPDLVLNLAVAGCQVVEGLTSVFGMRTGEPIWETGARLIENSYERKRIN